MRLVPGGLDCAEDSAANCSCDRDRGGRDRRWIASAVDFLAQERRRAADTPMVPIELPEYPGIALYLKDETAHPSGSLKHRLAHALFLHAICNGDIGPDTLVVEASSGSTAISEAWFARELGLSFVAVVPENTAPAKIAAIEAMGGEVRRVPPGTDICAHARSLATERGGYFMDQFTRAAEVTDWRGSNNIAESLFGQLAGERHPIPAWIVVGAGTGGTSATIGRFLRLRPELEAARLCVVDPEGSAFFKAFVSGDRDASGQTSGIVEGIGRARCEPSFVPAVVDQMLSIPDVASVAGAHWLEERMQRRFGPSTGTNIVGTLLIAQAMARENLTGSIVTLGCDDGARYAETIYDPAWLAKNVVKVSDWRDLWTRLDGFRFPIQG